MTCTPQATSSSRLRRTSRAYKAHFDVLMTAFGSDRLIWGSNWPVIALHGTFEAQIAIAEEYLAPFGTAVRDKVMFKNALAFYRRHKPEHRHHRD